MAITEGAGRVLWKSGKTAEDMIENILDSAKSKEKTLSETIKNIAGNIRENFENPVSLNADITADKNFSNLNFPDIPAVSGNIHTGKESPVTVENLNIYVDTPLWHSNVIQRRVKK